MKKSNRSISSARTMFFKRSLLVPILFLLLTVIPATSSPVLLSSVHFDLRFSPGLETEAAMILADSEKAYAKALALTVVPPDSPISMRLDFPHRIAFPSSADAGLRLVWTGDWYALRFALYRGIYRRMAREMIAANPDVLKIVDELSIYDASLSWILAGGGINRETAADRLRTAKNSPATTLKGSPEPEGGMIPEIFHFPRAVAQQRGNNFTVNSMNSSPGATSLEFRDSSGATRRITGLPFDLVREPFFDVKNNEIIFWGQRESLRGMFVYALGDGRLSRCLKAPDFTGPVAYDRDRGVYGAVIAEGGYRFVKYDRQGRETLDILMTSYLPLAISADDDGNCLLVVPRNDSLATYEYRAGGRLREIAGIPEGSVALFREETGAIVFYSVPLKSRFRIEEESLVYKEDASLVNSEPLRDSRWHFIKRSSPR